MKLSTETNYLNSLNRLSKYGIDIDNIDFELFEKMCIENEMNENGKNLCYNALLWHHKTKNIDDPIIDILREKIEVTRSKTIEKYMKHQLSDNEKNNFLKWDKVLKIRDILEKNATTNKKYLNYLILSLYTYNLPRRLDYSNMILDDNISINDNDIILWNDIEKNYVTNKINIIDSNNNYFVRKNDSAFFIFNDFKTNYKYGKQIIEVDPMLQKIINTYIEKNKILNNNVMIKLSKTSLSTKLSKIFKKYANKKISASMLRHIYITHLYDNELAKQNFDKYKYVIGKKMSHSNMMQSLYDKDIRDLSE